MISGERTDHEHVDEVDTKKNILTNSKKPVECVTILYFLPATILKQPFRFWKNNPGLVFLNVRWLDVVGRTGSGMRNKGQT